VSLLHGASTAALAQLGESARTRLVPARTVLFRAGDPADRLFVVLSGRLRVDSEDGELLREVGAGAVLGELALLTGSRRSASVRAVRDSRVLEVDAEQFLALIESDAEVALGVARELAQQLQASGGLGLRGTRPSVFAVVTAGLPDAQRLVDELERSLGRWSDVAVLQGEGLDPDTFSDALADAERRNGFVVLRDGPDPAWNELTRRQCDRLVVFVDGRRPVARAAGLQGCELVLVDVPGAGVARWLDALEPRAHHVVSRPSLSRDVDRVARRLAQRSLGVVFSGGGARGFAHVGVLAGLAEAGFVVDRVGGCSMGAFIAGLAALGHPAHEIHARCRDELVRRSPFNDYTLPRVALIRSRKARTMLERVFGGTLVEELERPLFTVSADLLSSQVVVHRRGALVDAVGASMCIPGLAPPLRRPGRLLVDGGVLNNLPVDHMAETEEGPIVAVDVVRRPDGTSGEEPPYPTITETLARATVLGSVERAERNRKLATLVVTPDVQAIGLRQWSAIDRSVEAGRRAAVEALEADGADRLRDALEAAIAPG
jgi:predicted acylesterase/phospholipase RssA/CRP-like cAMP-binding protein